MESDSILNHLTLAKEKLPKKQKEVCKFVIENYQEISVLSIKELAERVGVGPTTIMRFISNIGYDSYTDFKKEFHYFTIESSRPTWWHLKKSLTHINSENVTLDQTWDEALNLLDKSLNKQLADNFKEAVDTIIKSSFVNILGFRTSKAPAYYFEYMLSEFYPNIRQLSNNSEFIYDKLLHLNKDDILIIIALSPYTTLSIEVAEQASKKGIPIILITDHLSCPISSYAKIVLSLKSSQVQYSIIPVIALIEALVIEIGKRTTDHSIKHLNELNEILSEKNITTS